MCRTLNNFGIPRQIFHENSQYQIQLKLSQWEQRRYVPTDGEMDVV